MKELTKIEDGVTKFKAEHMNVPLYEADENFSLLENKLAGISSYNYIKLDNQKVKSTVPINRVVYFNGTEWDVYTDLVPVGEVLPAYPLGINQGTSTVYLLGRIKGISPTITVSGTIEVGVPYFLSSSGKITTEQPAISIHVGTFLNQTEFLMNVQFMTYSHQHRRALLDSTKWENETDYMLYPIEELDELPLPFRGVTLVIDGKYIPAYDNYTVDQEGIKILDNAYMQALLGTANIYTYLLGSNIEAFWSEPKTLTTPGVMTLESGTENIIISNKIESQSSTEGSLIIKNIPVLENTTTGSVVKNITVDEGGKLLIEKTNVVESIQEGNNVSINRSTGVVTINSASNKIQEIESSDIFLRGALSKQYSNTINTYIEYTYQRTTSAIFKFYMPYNLVESSEIELYAYSFGSLEDITTVSLVMRHGSPIRITDGYTTVSLSLPVTGINKISKNLLGKLAGVKANSWLYVQLERNADTTYIGNIGIIGLIAKCRVL